MPLTMTTTNGRSKKRKLESDVQTLQTNGSAMTNEYFMYKAVQASWDSPDPKKKVGACVVDADRKKNAIGFNRHPRGCENLSWDNEEKLSYVLHAEKSAIINKGSLNLEDGSIYVTLFPCNECAKLIIESGIKQVFYIEDKESHVAKFKTNSSKKMFKESNVYFGQLQPKNL